LHLTIQDHKGFICAEELYRIGFCSLPLIWLGILAVYFRENELLKHQLRKYVGAVQMLKRDGTQAHEALASLEASQPKAGDLAYPDYHHEAREYEKKLIQVSYFPSLC